MNQKIDSTDTFNDEPVFYCRHCLSLRIAVLSEDEDFCEECGSTDIDTTDIETWQKLYRKKYKKDF